MVNLRPPRVGRSAEVDEAILGIYLAGAGSHRIRKALTPLLGEKHLSKSAVSRLARSVRDADHARRRRKGVAEALTDGLLALRYLFGFRGPTLVTVAVDLQGCTRCDPRRSRPWCADSVNAEARVEHAR